MYEVETVMNKMMIVGTSALAFHGVDIEVNDTDIWGTTPSFNGHEIDGIVESLRVVTPVEKTITVYE